MGQSEQEDAPRNILPSRRSVLGGAAGGMASLFAATGLPRAQAQEASIPATGLPPFIYDLEGSEPTTFAGGTLRTATVKNIPALKDMAIFAEKIDSGAMREVHWHSNCGELNYCLSGEGTIGVFSPRATTPRSISKPAASPTSRSATRITFRTAAPIHCI